MNQTYLSVRKTILAQVLVFVIIQSALGTKLPNIFNLLTS
jgi:hypothetical protein